VIELRAGTRIWIAAGVTDMRRGFQGLSAQVQTVLEQQPFSGHVFVFRGRRGDTIKILWFDGDGLCLFAKRLERGRFIWPQATEGTVSLTPGSALDAHGRHRLAQTAEDLDAPDRSVSYARDSPVFMRLLWIFCHRSHGILRSWLPPLFPTSMGSISKP
jgi:transposase